MFFLVRKGLRLATLPHSTDIWRIWEIICHMYYTASNSEILAAPFNVAVGLLAASLTTIFSDCFHCVPQNLMPWKCCIPFSWLILTTFNNEIPLILWKLSIDHGFCCKMRLRKCQEKLTRTAEHYFGLIIDILNDCLCVLTPTLNMNFSVCFSIELYIL